MDLNVSFGITRRLAGIGLDSARARITKALELEGFGVLTEIDVKATLKKKLDVDVPPYVILGACNPKLAHEALTKEPAVGLLLPCNVVVAEDGSDTLISAVSPRAMFAILENPGTLGALAGDAETRLRRAIESA